MAPVPLLPLTHRRRLRELWRSAGWPCRDTVEVDLLAAGLLERRFDADQRETLHLTEAGIQALAATLARNRAAYDAHEALVARVAEVMQRAGRLVWCGLALRAPLAAPAGEAEEGAEGRLRWAMAMPDVYSIRQTTVEAYTEPVVHEVKVRRADLLADLKRPDKGAAYRALSSQCWYVLGPGVGSEADVPPEYGVLQATGAGLELARPAPRRPVTPDFAAWMALARANALPPPEEAPQAPLSDAAVDPSPGPGASAPGSAPGSAQASKGRR